MFTFTDNQKRMVNSMIKAMSEADEMDDSVSKAYAARPTRLYLIGTDGRVAHAGGLGPFGFKPAELKAAIEEILSSSV